MAQRFVIAAQEVDFLRQIVIDGARNAGVEKLRRCDAVEVSVEVGGIVQDLDVSFGGRLPFDRSLI